MKSKRYIILTVKFILNNRGLTKITHISER